MALNDIYRLTLEVASLTTGTPINNVLWFRETVGHADHGAADLGADFITHIDTTAIRNYQWTAWKWNSVRVQRMWPSVDPPVQTFYSPPLAGLGGAGAIPSVCCLVARLITPIPGRSFTGRLYLGGFAIVNSGGAIPTADDGHWYPVMVSNIANWLVTIKSRYVSGPADWEWHVHSRKLSTPFNPLVTPPSPPVTGITMDPVVRLQRSREFGVSRRHAGRH